MSEKQKILYVDDEEINVELFKINFCKNYEVLTGLNGIEGLDLLEKNNDIKVVISDMKMPVMTGIDFVNKAKARFNYIKFFILSGYDVSDEIHKAIDSGLIIDYFRKPFEMKKIEKSIREAIV